MEEGATSREKLIQVGGGGLLEPRLEVHQAQAATATRRCSASERHRHCQGINLVDLCARRQCRHSNPFFKIHPINRGQQWSMTKTKEKATKSVSYVGIASMIPMIMVPMIVFLVDMSFIEHASTTGDTAINHAQHAAWILNLRRCTAKKNIVPSRAFVDLMWSTIVPCCASMSFYSST
jgi:hypothetical protein